MPDDKIERIRAAYERDLRDRPKAIRYGDIPVSYDAITPEWLSNTLCRSVPGAEVASFRLGPVDDGTSNRRRIFVEYNEVGSNAGLPLSIFCKATHALVNRLILSSTGTLSEVNFYKRVKPLLEIDTPSCYFAGYNPESWASIIVLEDIGDDVEFCSEGTPMDKESVQSQLQLLAKMHGTFFNSDEFRGELADLFTFKERFQRLSDNYGLEECCNAGFLAAQDVIPARLFKRADEVWPATVRSVEHHDAVPLTFTHNDVHLKNWYVRDRPTMGITDWQSSGRGHWARDVAYCISTALEPEHRRTWERELLAFYLAALRAAGGPAIERDEAWQDYAEQHLSALAWWTMTLTPSADMPDMQPRDTTLVFIRRIATAIDDLGSLDVSRH